MTTPQSREADDGLFFGPCLPSAEEAEWTSEQLEQFAAEWRRKYSPRKVRLLTPLPRRVRLRLLAARQVDRAAIWLVGHKRHDAAERLWRVFGMWKR